MRAAAEIDPVALRIHLQRLVGRNRIDELDLVGLALAAEEGLGLVAAPFLPGEGRVLGDDLAHLLLDDRQVLGREGLVAGEIVEEAALDHRADRHLRTGPERLHGLGEDMGAVVPDQLERARVVAGQELDARIPLDRVAEIDDGAVDRHRDRALQQRGGNAARDRLAGDSGRKLALGAVGKCQGDRHRSRSCSLGDTNPVSQGRLRVRMRSAARSRLRVGNESRIVLVRRRVRPAPAAIGPRPIPCRPCRQFLADDVDARCPAGVAAADPRQPDPAAAPQAEALDRLVGIGRAARPVPALPPDQRREAELVPADRPMRSSARRRCEKT